MGRILAIDYGTKRVGIAVTDETKTISQPKPYILNQERNKLLEFIKEFEIEKILLGLPTALSGNETESTKKTRDFMVWLEGKTHLPVELIDERLTTKEILKVEHDREWTDSLVAQKLLERYLYQNAKIKNQND